MRRTHPGSFLWLAAAAILATMALVPLLAACRGQTAAPSGLQLELEVVPQPPAVGPAEVVVTIRGAGGSLISGASVDVEGNMSHAGMVPVRARAEAQGDGRYATRGFQFTMAGDWTLDVTAALPDGRKVERTFNLPGVGGATISMPAVPTQGGHR